MRTPYATLAQWLGTIFAILRTRVRIPRRSYFFFQFHFKSCIRILVVFFSFINFHFISTNFHCQEASSNLVWFFTIISIRKLVHTTTTRQHELTLDLVYKLCIGEYKRNPLVRSYTHRYNFIRFNFIQFHS